MTPEDSDTSTNLNYFKTYAEQDLADAREYLPGHDVEDLIIEVSEKVMPREVRQILRLAENHINELFLTIVETPIVEECYSSLPVRISSARVGNSRFTSSN